MNFGGTLRLNKFACFTLIFILFLIIYWCSGGASYPTDTSDLTNLKELLNAAIQASERGGQMVIDGKNRELNIKSKGKTKEGVNDPVTDADYASHCAMYYSLKNTFPKLTVISEEHSSSDSSCGNQPLIDVDKVPAEHQIIEFMNNELIYAKDVTIWIDPLDATKEYTEGLYQYVTTMVCVAIKGIPVIGVIHYPFLPQTYWGWFTKRASTNIHDIPYRADNKEHPRVVVSRSHSGKGSELAIQAFGPQTVISSAAGAGYKVMEVVNGTYDVYLHTTAIKKWDLCAGDAIIKTVGGKMTTAKGDKIDYSTDSGYVVSDGLLVTRYDHDFYLSKLPKVVGDVH